MHVYTGIIYHILQTYTTCIVYICILHHLFVKIVDRMFILHVLLLIPDASTTYRPNATASGHILIMYQYKCPSFHFTLFCLLAGPVVFQLTKTYFVNYFYIFFNWICSKMQVPIVIDLFIINTIIGKHLCTAC